MSNDATAKDMTATPFQPSRVWIVGKPSAAQEYTGLPDRTESLHRL
jgi:hypothetical protein